MRKDCTNCKHDDFLRKAICDDCYNTSDAPTKWEPAGNYIPDTTADVIKKFATELLHTINRTPARGSFDYEMGYEDGLCKAKDIIRDLVKEMVGDDDG